MARYCIVTDLTRPRPDLIQYRFDVRDDATTPHTVVQANLTHHFAVIRYDTSGVVISETLAQKRARLKSEADAYFKIILDTATAIDGAFAQLQSDAIGYRFPAGG